MASIKITFCEFCGRRIDKVKGILTLILYHKTRSGFQSNKTIWGKSFCDNCFKKLCSLKTEGDQIREEIEFHIDSRRIERKKIELMKPT